MTDEAKESPAPKERSKLKSVKTWVVIWAVLAESFVLYGMIIAKVAGLEPVALGLMTIIAEYSVVNVVQKKIFNQSNNTKGEK